MLRLASVRYMPTPLPRRNRRVHLSFSFPRSGGLPAIQGRSASASFVSRPAQRSLTFRPASSSSRPRRPSTPKTPTASSPPPSLRLLPAGTTLAGRDFHPLDTKRLFQGVRRVEKWRGGLGMAYRLPALSSAGASLAMPCSVSTSRSSNRTGRSPASGSRTRNHAFRTREAFRPVVSWIRPNWPYRYSLGNCAVP